MSSQSTKSYQLETVKYSSTHGEKVFFSLQEAEERRAEIPSDLRNNCSSSPCALPQHLAQLITSYTTMQTGRQQRMVTNYTY